MRPSLTAFILALILPMGAQVGQAQAQAAAAPGPAPTAPAAEPRFTIERFTVRGATLFTQDGLQLILAPYIGSGKDFADVQKALEALEKAYTSKGFSAVQVILPEQEIDDGEVEFDVVEAKIGKVVVEGNKYFDEANIRASLPQVQQGQPPNILRISDNLRLANENPAKQTTVLLRSGAEEGQVDAVVRVADERPNKLSLTLDNSGTQQTGLFRIGFGYQHSNIWNRDHVLNAQYVTAPNDDDKTNRLVSGIADAVARDVTGKIEVIVDWKSDVNPTRADIEMYRGQVRSYLNATGAVLGLIVFVTSGRIERVQSAA